MQKMARFCISGIGLVISFSSISSAQQWELGAEFGVGASHNPAITNPTRSAQTGFPAKPILSVICTQNLYQYFSGELRYLVRWGGPKLTADGTEGNLGGYSNVITYELLVHLKPRESRIRPFVAGGSGIRVYTGTNQPPGNQPLADVALLRAVTQVEPVISGGAGLKYMLPRGLQLRADFRTYMNPFPNDLIRPVGRSVIHGWSFDFAPMLGISYAF